MGAEKAGLTRGGEEVVAEARERTAAMTTREKRQLVAHFHDNWLEDPSGASALLSVDTTAAMTLLVAQLELGLLSEEVVQQAARDEITSQAQLSSTATSSQARPEDGYSQYQLELLRQVRHLSRACYRLCMHWGTCMPRSDVHPNSLRARVGCRTHDGDDAGPFSLPAAAAPHAAAHDAHKRAARTSRLAISHNVE